MHSRTRGQGEEMTYCSHGNQINEMMGCARCSAEKRAAKPKRKIVQIASNPGWNNGTYHQGSSLYALCDDGSLWFITSKEGDFWRKQDEVPQDE